MATMQLYIIAN